MVSNYVYKIIHKLNYELFCKRNGTPLSAHFIFLDSGSSLA